MAYYIEKLKSDDIDEVYNIESELLGTSSKDTILETLASNTLSYYLLKNEKEIIGFIEISLIPPECELFDIAIKKEFQGQKLSKLLIDYLIDFCKTNLCETIFLEVNRINYKAISLYENYGFKKYAERKNYYGDNDAILMKLDL